MVENRRHHLIPIQEDAITSAERRLKELREWLQSQDEKIKGGEGYVQGLSDALNAFGNDDEGRTVSANLKIFMNIGKAIYDYTVETCDTLEHSIRMAKSLKNENQVLRELILTMLGLPPNAENDEIEKRAKELGEDINRIISDMDKLDRAVEK